jgi:hypothetical protein
MTAIKIEHPEAEPVMLDYMEFQQLPPEAQVPDVSVVDSRFKGQGVKFEYLVKMWHMLAPISQVTISATKDNYSVTFELRLIFKGILIYAIDGKPLTEEQKGPFRFFVPGTTMCGNNAPIDNCANVKHVDGMQFH